MKVSIGLIAGIVSVIYLLITTSVLVAEAQVYQQWVARYDGPISTGDSGDDIAVDEDGNVYVTGSSTGDNSSSDYTTIKYDSTGVYLWVARYDGPSGGSDQPEDMVIDVDGSVYVTGRSKGDATDWDYATVKYDSDGNELWSARYNGTGNDWDRAYAVAVDPDGNVFVTGYSENLDDKDLVTIKYNSSGDQQWVDRYNGPGNEDDAGWAITADSNGYAYVTGYSKGTTPTNDYLTIKFDPSGARQWVARYNGPGSWYDYASAIALDAEGNVYVTGRSTGNGTSTDYATIKYDPNGNEQWVARYDGLVSDNDDAKDLVLDDDGNVYVTGESMGYGVSYAYDWATVKYDNDGAQQWVARYNGPGNYWDVAYDLAVDGAGNVYVAGMCTGELTGWDYTTAKYNAAGIEEWVICYDGPEYGQGQDIIYAMTIDDEGNTYVTGYSGGNGTDEDIATLKYSQTDTPYFELTLTPFVNPIQIPASGGSFEFYLSASNNISTVGEVDIWVEAALDDGLVHNYILGPANANLDPGSTLWHHTQIVPESALAGSYYYVAYIGKYPYLTWDSDSLVFTKLNGDGSPPLGDQSTWSDPFQDEAATTSEITPTAFFVSSVYPTPFNPTTSISFDLPEAGQVHLAVYDLQGRLVQKLVQGHRNAGSHQVTFEASNLASGIYLYHMNAGEFNTTGKMVLLK
ncbi:MAG: SBBP repeat-containing protein [bacterium]